MEFGYFELKVDKEPEFKTPAGPEDHERLMQESAKIEKELIRLISDEKSAASFITKLVTKQTLIYDQHEPQTFDLRKPVTLSGPLLEKELEAQRLADNIPLETWEKAYKKPLIQAWEKSFFKATENFSGFKTGLNITAVSEPGDLTLFFGYTKVRSWQRMTEATVSEIIRDPDAHPIFPQIGGGQSNLQVALPTEFNQWQILSDGYNIFGKDAVDGQPAEKVYTRTVTALRIISIETPDTQIIK